MSYDQKAQAWRTLLGAIDSDALHVLRTCFSLARDHQAVGARQDLDRVGFLPSAESPAPR